MKGLITYIQRMSIHDGPGLRSTVFLKGCNLRCKWCHNPETWSNNCQLQYLEEKCIHCFTCINVCENNVFSVNGESLQIDRDKCILCKKCIENCPSEALTFVGNYVDSDEIVSSVLQDKIFYENSNGGITISGGEPSLQKGFTLDILKKCKESDIHTAIETNLLMDRDVLESFFPYVDLWICDLKIMDSEKHKHWTGCSNGVILSNINTLSSMSAKMLIHTPVIPGVNDSPEDINSICSFLSELPIIPKYELLPYHSLGMMKFANLGMKNLFNHDQFLDKETLKQLNEIVDSYNLNAK